MVISLCRQQKLVKWKEKQQVVAAYLGCRKSKSQENQGAEIVVD